MKELVSSSASLIHHSAEESDEAFEVLLECIKSSHPEWISPDGDSTQCILYEYELVEQTSHYMENLSDQH